MGMMRVKYDSAGMYSCLSPRPFKSAMPEMHSTRFLVL